jgi:ABC-type dipeptide/oligopeptide/nickel transport system permease component
MVLPKNRIISIIALLSVLLSAAILQGLNPADIQSRLTAHAKYLASDELEGRKMGTEGNRKAAEYIANYFMDIKIQPFGESYFQEFPVITEVYLGR